MEKGFSFATMLSGHRMINLLMLICIGFFSSCQTIDLYEKNTAIPGHEWKSSFKPQYQFTIKDTAAPYQLFIVLRHNEKYSWNNLWVNLEGTMPDGTRQVFRLELPLATNEQGWLGTAMDDIYEHRIPLLLDPEKFHFNRPGEYRFTIQHIMREDPLANIMNIGLRLEKKSD